MAQLRGQSQTGTQNHPLRLTLCMVQSVTAVRLNSPGLRDVTFSTPLKTFTLIVMWVENWHKWVIPKLGYKPNMIRRLSKMWERTERITPILILVRLWKLQDCYNSRIKWLERIYLIELWVAWLLLPRVARELNNVELPMGYIHW